MPVRPELFGGLVAFGFQVVGELVLAMQAVQLDEIELGVVVLSKVCQSPRSANQRNQRSFIQ